LVAGAEMFDALAEFGVGVEECVRDTRFPLDGWEGDTFLAFDQCSDGPLRGEGLGARFGFRRGVEGGDPLLTLLVVALAGGH
jgi:hypothetical protein